MMRTQVTTLVLAALCCGALSAAETVGVDGTSTRFPTTLDVKEGDQPVKLALTGTALRKRAFFNVYALGSYIREGSGVRTAEQLAAADTLKQLHLRMERDIDGKTMAEAFHGAIRANYPAPAFADELTTLTTYMETLEVKKGGHIQVTHVPGVGLHVLVAGQKEILIKNVAFSRAVWEIYLGQKNLGEAIKQGLVSR